MQATLILDGRTAVKGTPLVMHNEQLADPLNQYTRSISEVSKKRNKTEADYLEIARLEFLGGMYANGNGPCLPAWNVLRCLQDGAKRHKRGMDVPRGISPLAQHADVIYDGPRDPDKMWKDGRFSLRKTVGIQRARTMRTRPIFVDWQCELPIEIDPVVFDLDTLRHVWREAGVYAGIGEMRPIYGRFEATIREEK
jgi:hypothetical protein